MTTKPFDHTTGPRDATTVIIGESWGKEDALVKLPFMGQSGQELNRLLKEAGIPRRECLLTNALNLRVNPNDRESLYAKRAEVGPDYTLPPISQGKYLRPEYLPEIDRLHLELLAHPRNLVITMGITPLWALCRTAALASLRGTVNVSVTPPGFKVLPTFHPGRIFQEWAVRPVVLADLLKASRERAFPEIRRPERRVLINPTLGELCAWVDHLLGHPPGVLAVDIETFRGQITMIGFAPSPQEAVVVPFFNFLAEGNHYWRTPEEEIGAWQLVGKILHSPIPKVFQNGLFDLQYLLRLRIRPRACTEDTMLLHHALYPEMKKGLGFLGSIYTNETAWKLMRHSTDMNKRDE